MQEISGLMKGSSLSACVSTLSISVPGFFIGKMDIIIFNI